MRLSIAPAGATSLDLLAALHAACFAEHWSREAYARLLAMPGAFALLAVDGATSDPVGFALGRMAAEECEVITLGVPPAHRRRGVGRALLAACLGQAEAFGAEIVFLEVGIDNPAARALYRSADFVEVGRRPRYYRRTDGGATDALIMRRRGNESC